MKLNSLSVRLTGVLLFSFASNLLAEDIPSRIDARGGPRVPPHEAFTACDGKTEGDKVSFITPRGETLEGTCKMMPSRLAAVPDHPPRQPRGDAERLPQ